MTLGYAPRFRLRAFGSLEQSARETLLRLLLEALVAVNVAYLHAHPATPRLMDSSVRYEPDDPGREEWKDIAETLSRGAGDCKDLVAWRLAELRIGGEHAAVARVEFHEAGDGRVLHHMTVRRASGLIEDPSRALGMLAVR
jgi:hypothetical protein